MAETKGILETLKAEGYEQVDYGFLKRTETAHHWITIFPGEKRLQMYGYTSEFPEEDLTYNTGIIEVTPGELNLLISIFTTNHQ